jgi:acyl carrier protein
LSCGADVDARIRSVLAEVFGLDPESVGPETSSDTVEAWDSLQHLTVTLSLEEEFGIQFDDEETVSLVSFPLISAILHERLAG